MANNETFNFKDLSYSILKPNSSLTNSNELEITYDLWRKNWFSLFAQLGEKSLMCSDEFTRQTEVLSIFYKNECIGCVGVRSVDISTPFGRDDSYVNVWPEQILKDILSIQNNIWIIGVFTINKMFAQRICGVPSIWLLGSIINNRIAELKTKFAVAIARKDAGINKLCMRMGAKLVAENQKFRGKECDLFLYQDLPEAPWDKYSLLFSNFFKFHRNGIRLSERELNQTQKERPL